MTATPRAFLLLAIVVAAIAPLPFAAADDCVAINTATFSDTIRVIANTGRQIALGFKSSEPGNGAAFVVIITPSVCSGFGLGNLEAVGGLDPVGMVEDYRDPPFPDPTYLPLP